MKRTTTLDQTTAATRWLQATHQRQASVLCTPFPIYRARAACSYVSWPTLPTACLTGSPQRNRHRPHNYFGYCFTCLALLSTKPWVNGFVTAFGRPSQAFYPTLSVLTFETRYCHGLWSGVASRPLANCFIYRIAGFGRVNKLSAFAHCFAFRTRCRDGLFRQVFRHVLRPIVSRFGTAAGRFNSQPGLIRLNVCL